MPTLNDILTANGDYTPVSGYPVDDKYENDSPVINVYDRTIGEIVGDTSTSGENVSQYLTFRIPRHPDHYDLIENGTNIRILYRLEDDTGDDVVPVNVVANEDYIIFGWKIPLVVTVNPGVVTFIIHAYKSENNIITYHYKTLPKTYMILETMETDVVVPEIEMYNLAEAYARGTITDVFGHTRPVEENEPGYHDNSKYYKELAGTSKIDAETAKNAAEAAQGAAETAQHAAENARDQAVAIVGGEYVSYGQTQSLNDTQKNKARENIGATAPNGYYPNMTVGLSENFVGTGEPTRRIFNYNTAGGSADISDGNAEIEKMYGDTIVWNQLTRPLSSITSNGVTAKCNDGMTIELSGTLTTTWCALSSSSNKIPIVKDHEYFISCKAIANPNEISCRFSTLNSSVTTQVGEAKIVKSKDSGIDGYTSFGFSSLTSGTSLDGMKVVCQLIDLTQMFGAGNEPTTVEEFKAMFPLDYYPYDEGTLLNVNPAGIKTVGFNAYDKATGKAELIGGNQYQITGTYTSLSYSTGEVLTPDSTGCFTPTKTGELTVTGGGENTCVHLTWSGYRNGDYEEYWTRTRDINIQPYFPDGLKRAGTVYDEISKDKAIKRIGVVDLGTLDWAYITSGASVAPYMYVTVINLGIKRLGPFGTTVHNIICSKYITVARNTHAFVDKTMCADGDANNLTQIQIKDSAYTDATAFKTAMSGVMLYYELDTPIETQIDPPLNLLYQVSDFGTEQFLGAGATEPKTLPIIADIVYGVNYRDTIKNLPKNYSKVRGYYPDLYTGLADNLIDRKGNGTPQEISYRTSCGDDSIADDGNGIIQSILGKTVVWNQMVDPIADGSTQTIAGLSITRNSDGSFTLDGTTTQDTNGDLSVKNVSFLANHKYLCLAPSNVIVTFPPNYSTVRGSKVVSVTTTESQVRPRFYFYSGDTFTNQKVYVGVFDLTQMFGAGNEPSTLDDPRIKWIKDYANEYPEYNSGELISYNGSGIKTVGFNQWDEEWESGAINGPSGEAYATSTRIRSKNYVSVLPNTTYYIKMPYAFSYAWYDAEKRFISGDNSASPNYTRKSPNNARYLKFSTEGTTYNHDICINLSWSGYRNGEYEPYWSRTLNLPISTYFPDGMKSAGSVRDELTKDKAVKRIGVVDLGTIDWVQGGGGNKTSWVPVSWRTNVKPVENTENKANILCSKYKTDVSEYVEKQINDKTIAVNRSGWVYIYDSAYVSATPQAFKTAMSGVMLYYELAEPIETTITPPLDLTYKVADFGTEESIAEGKSTPFNGIIKYSDDFTRGLVNMPKNYDTTASLDALAASLSTMLTSALDGTVTITRGEYDPATKKYEWNCQFTKNQSN